MRILLKNFRIVDAGQDFLGSVLVSGGKIAAVDKAEDKAASEKQAEAVIDGHGLSLMPAFVDMHAHFRDNGLEKGPLAAETVESGSLAASAGGFGTVVCMANTRPVIDNLEAASRIKARADSLGLIDLYPALSLTGGMEGKKLNAWLEAAGTAGTKDAYRPLLISEDGKDVEDDAVFEAALQAAAKAGVVVSCHCGKEGDEPERVERAVRLGIKTGCKLHLAHLSCKAAVEAYAGLSRNERQLSCETTPLYISATQDEARPMGTYGRVNPPLRTEGDRQYLLEAIKDGIIDVIATDHAPHTEAEKAEGMPGFTGLETAFAASYTNLVKPGIIDMKRLSALMSANPAHILGLQDRGIIKAGLRADLVVVAPEAEWTVEPERFRSRGHCTALRGKKLYGKVLTEIFEGRIVYSL